MRASRFVNYRVVFVLVLIAVLSRATPVRAGFMLVTDSNSLGANDSASWSGFDVNNPTIVSTNGIKISVQQGGYPGSSFFATTLSGNPAILDQGGAIELNNAFSSQSQAIMTLNFSQPVTAAGALMDSFADSGIGPVGLGFQLAATDSNGNRQFFTIPKGSGFVGIVSDTGNLTSLSLVSNIALASGANLVVGPVELQDSPLVSSAPAPSGLTLTCLGALGLLGCRCWRRCRTAIA